MTTYTTRLLTVALLALAVLAWTGDREAAAQTISNTTTASAAIDASQTSFALASTASVSSTQGPNSAYKLFWPSTGEIMDVRSIPASGTVIVRRGTEGTYPMTIASGATVIILYPDQVTDHFMGGSCTRGTGFARYSPLVNRTNGEMYVCRSSVWQTNTVRVITQNSLPPFTP